MKEKFIKLIKDCPLTIWFVRTFGIGSPFVYRGIIAKIEKKKVNLLYWEKEGNGNLGDELSQVVHNWMLQKRYSTPPPLLFVKKY